VPSPSDGRATVTCPCCGRERHVSARTARRGAGKCRWCLSGDGVIEAPSDEDRTFWLSRFDDETIYEMALGLSRRRPDRAHICSERARLLVLLNVPARAAGTGP
jgi:hypothetical protein